MANGDRPHADDGEMRAHLDNIFHQLTEIKAMVTLTNGRVRLLEKWRSALGGALVLLGVVVGSGAAWLAIFGVG